MRIWQRTWDALGRRTGPAAGERGDRGDVPGWVLVTLMTAGLVAVLWFVAEDALRGLFVEAVNGVSPRSGG